MKKHEEVPLVKVEGTEDLKIGQGAMLLDPVARLKLSFTCPVCGGVWLKMEKSHVGGICKTCIQKAVLINRYSSVKSNNESEDGIHICKMKRAMSSQEYEDIIMTDVNFQNALNKAEEAGIKVEYV